MCVIMGLVIGLACLSSSQSAMAGSLYPLLQAAGLRMPAKPMPAADFALPDLTGHTLRLHEQRGKVVFLNFWATWCAPCRQEMPLMEEVYQALRQQPFVMWAINLQESREEVGRFMQEQRLYFPALLDLDGTVSGHYNVRGLPTTYLIDCVGMIVGQAVGPRSWSNNPTRTLLAALLNDTRCHRPTPVNPVPQAEKDS